MPSVINLWAIVLRPSLAVQIEKSSTLVIEFIHISIKFSYDRKRIWMRAYWLCMFGDAWKQECANDVDRLNVSNNSFEIENHLERFDDDGWKTLSGSVSVKISLRFLLSSAVNWNKFPKSITRPFENPWRMLRTAWQSRIVVFMTQKRISHKF
jgi:hypothetical protein